MTVLAEGLRYSHTLTCVLNHTIGPFSITPPFSVFWYVFWAPCGRRSMTAIQSLQHGNYPLVKGAKWDAMWFSLTVFLHGVIWGKLVCGNMSGQKPPSSPLIVCCERIWQLRQIWDNSQQLQNSSLTVLPFSERIVSSSCYRHLIRIWRCEGVLAFTFVQLQ